MQILPILIWETLPKLRSSLLIFVCYDLQSQLADVIM